MYKERNDLPFLVLKKLVEQNLAQGDSFQN